MATRGTIAVRHADGTVSQIYTHWDSYLENNGRILHEHYTTLEQVEAIVAGGDMSSLGVNKDCCEYYTARGEDLNIRKYENILDYSRRRQNEEYDYLWEQGQWKVVGYETDGRWMLLTEALEELT